MSGTEILSARLTPTDSLSTSGDGQLRIEGCGAKALVERFGSPLFVVSERTLRANFRRASEAFASRWPAPTLVLYALKANNNVAVRAVLSSEGAGGDCFGDGELHATVRGGADPAKVVANGSNKSPAHLRRCVELGICINVDGQREVERIAAVARELGRRARVAIRIKTVAPEFASLPAAYRPECPSLAAEVIASQWGLSPAIAAALARQAREDEAIELEGFSTHLGRESTDPGCFQILARAFGRTVTEVSHQLGAEPRVLDLGGGYARERDPESGSQARNEATIEDYAEAITAGLGEGLAEARFPTPALWVEPGRYIAGNAGVLLATVGSVKDDFGRRWLNLDASINNLPRAEAGFAYTVLPASRMGAEIAGACDVVGSLCTGKPLAEAAPLPALGAGDLLAFLDAGMYAETASTQYNGVPRPATVLVNEEEAEVIKVRESVEDVFRAHRVPERLRTALAGSGGQ